MATKKRKKKRTVKRKTRGKKVLRPFASTRSMDGRFPI